MLKQFATSRPLGNAKNKGTAATKQKIIQNKKL